MKKLTILGIVVFVGLLFAPAAVIGDPAGPPGGLDVTVLNEQPIPVTGDIGATVTGDVTVTNDSSNPVLENNSIFGNNGIIKDNRV